jgi:hypothetical protein
VETGGVVNHPPGSVMSEQRPSGREPIPLGQRILDSPLLLLALGIVVPTMFYTVWGLIEIFTLPPATLP